jgi:glycosyltransferase involved in cell wall biosynthesis
MKSSEKSLLYIDMAYTLEVIKAKKHQQFFEARHSGGYFRNIWAVHPLSDIASGNKSSKIKLLRFSPRQLVIEGVAEVMSWPRALLPLNFVISQLSLLLLLRRLIKRHDISAVVATGPLYSGLLGLCLKMVCRKPLSIFIYANADELYSATGALSMPRLFPWRFLEKLITRLVLSNADLVVGGNSNNLQHALNYCSKETASAVFPNSIYMHKSHLIDPNSRFGGEEILSRLQVPLNRSYLLFVGRLLKLKHPEDAIKAMKFVVEKDPSVIGIIAGDGPMREELENLVYSLGLTENVIFIGHVDQEILSLIIPKCITLSPLSGMALIECGLGGSPVVAYNRDWQADFINDGINGFVVDFRDHEEMGRRALNILRDHDLRGYFSSKIRVDALAYSDLEKLQAHEHQVFEKMFEAWGRAYL